MTNQTQNQNQEQVITQFKYGKYSGKIYEKNGQYISICLKDTPKARYSKVAVEWHLRHSNLEKAIEYVDKIVGRWQEIDQEKVNRELQKKAASLLPHQYQVGQILYTSWGYEQTNIDFYQIVAVNGKKVTYRAIAGNITEQNHAYQGKVKPVVNDFRGPEQTAIVQTRVSWDGQTQRYIKIDRHYGYLTSPESEHYCSWGY